jgi:hypothetical protein
MGHFGSGIMYYSALGMLPGNAAKASKIASV